MLVQRDSGAANWSESNINEISLCDSQCIDSNGSVFHVIIDCATDTDLIIIIMEPWWDQARISSLVNIQVEKGPEKFLI